MSITIRRGEFEATLSGDLEQQIRDALGETGRRVFDEIKAATERLYRDAYDGWPVKTGASRDSLRQQTVIRADGVVVGEVRAEAGYARYIQSWQLRDNGVRYGAAERIAKLGVNPARQLQVVRQAGRRGSRAAQSGSAMWLLLRWPEKDAGERLEVELGPIVSRALQSRIDR